jgi:glutamine amidotransferase
VIAIVGYGLGNVQAFLDVYRRLDRKAVVAQCSGELESADKIILPGVGAFDWAMERLNKSGMRDALDRIALEGKRPILGVCVGMQMMARRSEEGSLDGLGWIPADVKRLDHRAAGRSCLPHMGWNTAEPTRDHPLFFQIKEPSYYFLHSYHFSPDSEDITIATTDYSQRFASAICHGNLLGTQFHPEKSHGAGVRLLENFANL